LPTRPVTDRCYPSLSSGTAILKVLFSSPSTLRFAFRVRSALHNTLVTAIMAESNSDQIPVPTGVGDDPQAPVRPFPSWESGAPPSIPSVDDHDSRVSTTARSREEAKEAQSD
jgi:hypothetical protein